MTKKLIEAADDHQQVAPGDPDDYCRSCAESWPCVTRSLADALESATRVPVQGEPNDDREELKRIAEVASEQRLKDSIAEYKDATSDEMEPTDWELEFWHAGYKSGALSIIEHNLSRATVPDDATEELETLRDIAETHAFCADRLSIETERADRVARGVCDRGCSYTGGPDEECSAHGRTPRELWDFIAQDIVGRDAATARAEKAEAERDAALAAVERVRAAHPKNQFQAGGKAYDYCGGCYEPFEAAIWPCPTVAALDGAPEPDTAAIRERVSAALREVLNGQEAMHCNRVWEAWGVGTMSADDFTLVTDDEGPFNEIVDAAFEAAAGAPPMLTESQVWAIAQGEHDYNNDTDNVAAYIDSITDSLRAAGVRFDEQPFIDGGLLLPVEGSES